MTELREGRLQPRPEFQRRLVWANKHKLSFLETVLKNYPFPEIYIATGELDTETGESKELLVDGQQRMTTLYQYFTANKELKLGQGIVPYTSLDTDAKRRFLEYEVVIRDLGNIGLTQVKEVFQRINSTRYALTAMEVHNARFDGAFKLLGEEVAESQFFEEHRIFSGTDVRRMEDVKYCLVLLATMMDTYFNRDDELENYLTRFNDDLPEREFLRARIQSTTRFLEECEFSADARVWKKADLFTAIVEVDAALAKRSVKLSPTRTGGAMRQFYEAVDALAASEFIGNCAPEIAEYYFAALQASNDRTSRATRGKILAKVIQDSAELRSLFDT